jgi:5'-phosphate synthase pdxT subunit
VVARLGVLALQGDFAEHLKTLERLGVDAFEVRSQSDLEDADALIIPGGESTAIIKLIDRFDIRDALTKRLNDGMPVFGTCAGAIVLANDVSDGERPLGVIDLSVRRNAYGRQNESFEADIDLEGIEGGRFHAVFIRAPVFEGAGEGSQVLARWADQPVLIRSGRVLVSSFHPELTDDTRIHDYFLKSVAD